MTAAINGDHPGVQVSEVAVVNEGTEGSTRWARMALTYASGTGPRAVILKSHASAHRLAELIAGTLFTEPRLFASGMPIEVEHPHVYLAARDHLRLNFLMVIEDVAGRGGKYCDPAIPMSVDQVASGVQGLARFHRHYWGMTASSHPALRWVKPVMPGKNWQTGLLRRISKGLMHTFAAPRAPFNDLSTAQIMTLWSDYSATLSEGPATLLHADCNIANAYVLPGDEVGFAGWHWIRRGNCSLDLGTFITGALSVEDRRRHDRYLLDIYRDALQLPDDDAPAADELWQRYRQSHVHGLAIWLSRLGIEGRQTRAACEAMVERYAAAFADMDTPGGLRTVE
jgi:hypothetical protein